MPLLGSRRRVLIARRLYDGPRQRLTASPYGSGFMMGLLLIGILSLLVGVCHAVDTDIYPDIEDMLVERLANSRLRQRVPPSDAYLDADADAEVEAEVERDEPDFTYQFPPASKGGVGGFGDSSPFVRPPDPRYYHDPRRPMNEGPVGSAATQDDDVFEPPRSWPSSTSSSTPTTPVEEPADVEALPAGLPAGVPAVLLAGDLPHARMSLEGAHSREDEVLRKPLFALSDQAGIVFFTIVFVCCSVAVMIVLVIALAWVKLTRRAKAAADVEYPAYGVTGPHQKEPSPTGDRKLAQSAQMYHYQHQKQQIIAMESRAAGERRASAGSPAESDDDNEEGDYTVYECPGLAPTGEMEVKNPLFHDEPTPATPAPKDK